MSGSTSTTAALTFSSEYRAQFLLELSKAANSFLELPDVLAALATSLHPRIHFDAIGLLVTQGEHLVLNSLFVYDFPRRPGESVVSLINRLHAHREDKDVLPPNLLVPIPIDHSCVAQFARDRRPYVCNDLSIRRRFLEEDELYRKGILSYVSIPLLRQETLIGAMHFICHTPRDFDPEELQILEDASLIISMAVSNALAYDKIKRFQERLQDENRILQDEIDQRSMYEEIIGSSPELKRVLATVEKVAPTTSTVLLTGETGTGKELIARAIHRRSPRKDRALVKVNCAALPADLIASELFGHEKGAFTGALHQRIGRFETADGGTIFLDEIGELSQEMQVALLRVLQEREFERVGGNRTIRTDVRIIAATNRDLAQEVAAGRFRSDLYYRLNVFPIHMPSLRERREDIPLLIEYFTARFSARIGKRIEQIDRITFRELVAYSWPGNIREMQNIIERAVILADANILRVEPGSLVPGTPAAVFAALEAAPVNGSSGGRPPTPAEEHEIQRTEIESMLRQTRGRVSGPRGAAARLGIPASTLESRIRALGINKHTFR